MILLKANSELKNIFGRMLKAMKVNVAWTGNFVVLNNFLILSGNVRSLVFNFDNRKVNTNIIELPDREEDAEAVEGNEFLANVLNMSLYAFGKWGVIKGIRVDQDYSQLNNLFREILKDLKITPGFRDDNFRFYKENLQITYEEVVQAAIEEGKRKAQELKEEEENQPDEHLGLWHKICWKTEQCSFARSELTEYEKNASRLGNNFYLTGFHCAVCKEKLFMVIYPEGEEYPVDTQEGKVFLSRAYTCQECNSFYTPRPGKLLREGDVYSLKFGSDKDAYEDYQELLGRAGERTANYHFNEYEWERGKRREPETIERACAEMEDMTEEELLALEGKLEAGFYPMKKAAPYQRRIRELLRRKQERHLSQGTQKESGSLGKEQGNDVQNKGGGADKKGAVHTKMQRTGEETVLKNAAESQRTGAKSGQKDVQSAAGQKEAISGNAGTDGSETTLEKDRQSGRKASAKAAPSTDKYDARMKVLNRMSLRQIEELKRQIQTDPELDHVQKSDYNAQISRAAEEKETEEIKRKADNCKDKSYSAIMKVMGEIEKSRVSGPEKLQILNELEELRKKRGQEEARQLVESVPAAMNHSQYQSFRERLSQYEDVDVSAYEEVLKKKRSQAAKLELEHMLRRAKNGDRKSLMKMLKQIGEGFAKEDAAPVRKEIEERLRKLDEAAIDKICPNIMGMTFDEAAEAYEKIEGGAFLPELKTNTLEMIDKRLTKLKMDECGLLVEKLKEELSGIIKDPQRLHFYEVRKIMRGDWEPQEAALAATALNTYAADRSRYEYPILICDSSGRKNGREGFLLTPDHIFYNSAFNSEKIPVRSITGIRGNTGILSRGIYVSRKNGVKTKIPGGIPARELEHFGEALDQFVAYLQEKPESRSIAYLAKEMHEVKCCYRCGFTYQEGNVCPKCGNQANR
ncbi:MAG: hypothetical protein HFI69_07175 [Lachnospiraceae bacterium]|nr:hypothetical protein [Lachnospiraceae bacterium]